MLDGSRSFTELAAIGEAVGSDVYDSHQARQSLKFQRFGTQTPAYSSFGIVEGKHVLSVVFEVNDVLKLQITSGKH